MSLQKPELVFNKKDQIYNVIDLEGVSLTFYHLEFAESLFKDLLNIYYDNLDLVIH